MSDNFSESLKEFENFSEEDFYSGHINYAKGILYFLNEKPKESNIYLKLIIKKGLPVKKIKDIERMIKKNNNYS